MKRTVKLSLGMCFIMLALVLIAPHLASPKLVLRFLPKDEMEQMLYIAGFQNIRSRMITPFTYVSVGRKKEKKPARYEHLGMKLDRVRSCGERFHMYDLIRE